MAFRIPGLAMLIATPVSLLFREEYYRELTWAGEIAPGRHSRQENIDSTWPPRYMGKKL